MQSLETRRLRYDLLTVYKIFHGFIDISSCRFFAPSPALHRTRGHAFKLFVGDSKLNSRKYFFSRRVVDFWNSLPADIVSLSSFPNFKRSLDAHFADNGFW